MNLTVQLTSLEQDLSQWQKRVGSNINPVSSDALEISLTPDGWLKFSNAVSQNMGGGLIARALPLPFMGSTPLPYFGLDFDFMVLAEDLPYLGRFEADLKFPTVASPTTANIVNMVNGSTQWNQSESGMWQVANAAQVWADTGYKTAIATGTVTHYASRGVIDFTNQKYSMLSISQGSDAPWAIPASLQGIALQPSNWTQGALQLQTEALSETGLDTFYRNIIVTMATQKF